MKRFPIMQGANIPWWLIEPFEGQAKNNHDQSLRELAQRGGLDPIEAWCVFAGKKWRDAPKKDHWPDLMERWKRFAVVVNHPDAIGETVADAIKDLCDEGTTYTAKGNCHE